MSADQGTTTVELLNRHAKKQRFALPAGWEKVRGGAAMHGDLWWRWADESWQPIDEHAFLGSGVGALQCVIRRSESASVRDVSGGTK